MTPFNQSTDKTLCLPCTFMAKNRKSRYNFQSSKNLQSCVSLSLFRAFSSSYYYHDTICLATLHVHPIFYSLNMILSVCLCVFVSEWPWVFSFKRTNDTNEEKTNNFHIFITIMYSSTFKNIINKRIRSERHGRKNIYKMILIICVTHIWLLMYISHTLHTLYREKKVLCVLYMPRKNENYVYILWE